MVKMSIQRGYEGGSFVDDAHTRMAMAVNPPFMALGTTKEAFQVQVVPGQVRIIAPDEQTGTERRHNLRHDLTDALPT